MENKNPSNSVRQAKPTGPVHIYANRGRAGQTEREAAEHISREPETRPISQEQIVAEVKGILAGLLMVEAKCIEIEKKQAAPSQREPVSQPRLNSKPSNGFIVQQRGIKVLIKNRKDSAFGDTGAGQNVISERRRKELGLDIRLDPTTFPMGNSKKIFSPGTVEVPLAFEDDPSNILIIIAHVVHTFAYDLLLGNPFLQATKCLTKFVHRFVPCLFSFNSMWSFNLLGETTQRFCGHLGKGIPFLGLPDIGSTRNVMNATWAMAQSHTEGFEILTEPRNCGWILFPDGTEEATMGQAQTNITLPDGKVVPVVFELLSNCHVPVVLGQDFIFDHDIYTKYAASLFEFEDVHSGDELMPMGFRQNRSDTEGSSAGTRLAGTKQEEDLERQLEWNLKYQDGRTASVEEWNLEHTRRERYELLQNPGWRPDPRISLIGHSSKAADQPPGIGQLIQPPTHNTLISEEYCMVQDSSDNSSPSQSGETTFIDSSASSSTLQDSRASGWNSDPYLIDSLVSGEVAQWQAS